MSLMITLLEKLQGSQHRGTYGPATVKRPGNIVDTPLGQLWHLRWNRLGALGQELVREPRIERKRH